MNKILNYLKKSNFIMPVPVGRFLARIPFSYRPGIGKIYKRQTTSIKYFSTLNQDQKEDYIFKEFYRVFKHAYLNIPFYSKLYKSHGLKLEDVQEFSDITNVPIVSKMDLIDVPLEERSFPVKNRLIVNTGGSSGKPLSFYMDPQRYGNEWAHLLYIWGKLGYKPSSLKLGFDGRSSVEDYVQYDFVRNTFRVDIYADKNVVCDKLYDICKSHNIEFLHGYPSAISEFASFCNDYHPELAAILRTTLKAAFLNSEYPAPHYRDKIKNVFRITTQSFYGHTETCVFAEEVGNLDYFVHQTYGYAEAVHKEDFTTTLVGTSYFNFASPLIRYNTQDLIEVSSKSNDLLECFKVKEGREGEFILDANNSKISLTGLIFGRHHKLFDYCFHVQLKQLTPGKALVYYVPKNKISDPNLFFDSHNVNIKFEFEELDKPVLTNSGKINLLIK